MKKKLIVYDHKIIAQDEGFRKYKKYNILDIDLDSTGYPIGTLLEFSNKNVARVTKVRVDMENNIEYYEAVALNKWL